MVALLIWTCLAAGAALVFFLEAGRRAEIRQQVALMEAHVRKLEQDAPDERLLVERGGRLQGELEQERRRLYAPGEMDPYRFGLIVRDLLVAEGLQIDRYQTLEAGKRTLLEFAVRGEARGMLAFLRRVSLSERTWSVPYLSIGARGETGMVQSVFRIHYAQLGEKLD